MGSHRLRTPHTVTTYYGPRLDNNYFWLYRCLTSIVIGNGSRFSRIIDACILAKFICDVKTNSPHVDHVH